MTKSGGDYIYLKDTFGSLIGFLFAWISVLVLRTSSLAIIALSFGTYAVTSFYESECPPSPLLVKLMAAVCISEYGDCCLIGRPYITHRLIGRPWWTAWLIIHSSITRYLIGEAWSNRFRYSEDHFIPVAIATGFIEAKHVFIFKQLWHEHFFAQNCLKFQILKICYHKFHWIFIHSQLSIFIKIKV